VISCLKSLGYFDNSYKGTVLLTNCKKQHRKTFPHSRHLSIVEVVLCVLQNTNFSHKTSKLHIRQMQSFYACSTRNWRIEDLHQVLGFAVILTQHNYADWLLKALHRLLFHGRCSNKYFVLWVFGCSLSYPASHAHAPYYISSVTSLDVLYFSILSHKTHYFRNTLLTCNVCSDFLYNICLKYFMSL
jgi:hypothetical protein